jgi:MFS family permease
MGLGIGQAGVIASTYLAEIAPAHTRGMLVSLFGMSEYIGIMVGVSQKVPCKRVIVVLTATVLRGLGSRAAYF